MFWLKNPLNILILAFSSLSFISNSQLNSIELTIQWMQPETIVYDGVSLTVPNIKDQTFDSGKPIFYYTQKLKSSNSTLSLKRMNLLKNILPASFYIGGTYPSEPVTF